MNKISWVTRKLDHIDLALKIKDGPITAGFEDIRLLHYALPENNLAAINISKSFLGKTLQLPLIINALTGGAEELTPLNKALARAAGKTGVAMAVGSQSIAFQDKKLVKTFRVVRENNKDGVILANVGASTNFKNAIKAVEMIEADGLQLHLNVPQELIMPEGDRCFQEILENISDLLANIKVPVIVKEVGFGMNKEVVQKLMSVGVQHFDVGGLGGTNFIAIENRRNQEIDYSYLEEWGIPTICSLIEVLSSGVYGYTIATGGVKNPLDAVKALAIGADLVGMAGVFIKIIKEQSEAKLIDFIQSFKEQMQKIILMTGASNLKELSQKPLVISGFSRTWLHERGIKTDVFAQR